MKNSNTPLRLIVGFSVGSASDDIAHLIAEPLGQLLEQSVTIERIAGESGTTAARRVAQASPDGNTLFVATLGTHALAPHARSDVGYDVVTDFAPVSLLTHAPMLLACHPALPVRHLADFIDYARGHPATLAFGTSAFGGAPHLAAELFQAVSATQLVHARYDDTRKLYADLEAGRIALSFNNVMSMLPRCASGVLRGLGVTAAERCAAAPALPTLAEGGLEGCEVSNWIGLVAPRATEAARVQALAMAAAAVIHGEAVAARLAAAGITACGSTPEAFAALIADERTRWGPIVKRFA